MQTTKNLHRYLISGLKRQYPLALLAYTLEAYPDSCLYRSTDFNLGAAILAFWVLGTNLLLKWARVRHRWTELFLRSCVFVSWILCLISQLSGDLSDADHQSRVPWYLSHSKSSGPNKASRDVLTGSNRLCYCCTFAEHMRLLYSTSVIRIHDSLHVSYSDCLV
jgi:hypothetical protein